MRYACGIYYDNDQLEWTELLLERETFDDLLVSASKWIERRRNAELSWAVSVTKKGNERNITERFKKELHKKGVKNDRYKKSCHKRF